VYALTATLGVFPNKLRTQVIRTAPLSGAINGGRLRNAWGRHQNHDPASFFDPDMGTEDG
jgi:hypothetical protein